MAKVINVNQKVIEKKPSSVAIKTKQPAEKKIPLFRKFNYILMIIGVVFLIAGYILLSGGGSDDPTVFSEAIFDTRRLVIAPIAILLGLIIEIFAIMWHPKTSD